MAGAFGNFVLDKGRGTSAAVTKRRFVKLVGEETVAQVSGATDNVYGVSLFTVTTDDQARDKGVPVRLGGIAEVEAGATVVAGDLIVSGTDGRAVPTGTTGAGTQVVGVAETGGATGDHIAVKLSLL